MNDHSRRANGLDSDTLPPSVWLAPADGPSILAGRANLQGQLVGSRYLAHPTIPQRLPLASMTASIQDSHISRLPVSMHVEKHLEQLAAIPRDRTRCHFERKSTSLQGDSEHWSQTWNRRTQRPEATNKVTRPPLRLIPVIPGLSRCQRSPTYCFDGAPWDFGLC